MIYKTIKHKTYVKGLEIAHYISIMGHRDVYAWQLAIVIA